MVDRLSNCALYASAPSWDGQWLSRLLRAAGLPRHALRLHDTEEAQKRAAMRPLRAAGVPIEECKRILLAIVERAEREVGAAMPVTHRALGDAQRELAMWRAIGRLAQEAAGYAAPQLICASTRET
jgi:hypothetical protein